MPITRPNFDALDQDDIAELVETGVPEGISLDYKQETYGTSNDQKKEFLKDLSSFANTNGGHLVLGIAEVGGTPSEIVGLPDVNIDAELQRLEALVRTGFDPNPLGILMRPVQMDDDKTVIVIRVPKSWNAPHQVSAYGTNRFWARNSAGAHQCSVEELRHLFTATMEFTDRVRDFRDRRINSVTSDQAQVPIAGGARLLLHLVPMNAFASRDQVSPQSAHALQHQFRPMGNIESFSPRFNLDGFINVRGGSECHGYTQVDRKGIIEAVKCSIEREMQGQEVIPLFPQVNYLFDAVTSYMKGLEELGIPTPVVVIISMTGVQGAYLGTSTHDMDFYHIPILRQNNMSLPEAMIESYGDVVTYRAAMKPSIDALWNAAGLAACEDLGEDGSWERQNSQ